MIDSAHCCIAQRTSAESFFDVTYSGDRKITDAGLFAVTPIEPKTGKWTLFYARPTANF
jgi:hypothetical protein